MKNDFIHTIPGIQPAQDPGFLLIAGPCVVENRETLFQTAEKLKEICNRLKIPLIFKASYRKANRTRLDSFKGIGDSEALNLLDEVKRYTGLPVLTDVHETKEVDFVARFADVLQIPAFLCRQTELIQVAAQTGKPVNLKKGQFLSAEAMRFGVEKIVETGNSRIFLTERGSTFGYGDLVVDFRGIPIMKSWGYPVVLDITHSLQAPNQPGGITGGNPQMIETIARAGIASGVDGIFMETHPNPSQALSDGSNMLPLSQAEKLLFNLLAIYRATKTLDQS
ncbi:MAG: 3-deoxy-8-phosphooctulonate synthase [Bacteroidetes bacterium GWF2_49_14]|nr:MAG: 3-deoxy-8-phosphooctulonate synthase [Bacteroidetes bacterium GWF2_49_14]HBB92741.1 3-deoxy-8-phosphooctulonate synthase [Bacteroidales bacterium]